MRIWARRRRRPRRLAGGVLLAAALAVPSFLPIKTHTPMPYAVPPTLDARRFYATASAPPTGPTVAPTSVVSEKNGYRIRIPAEPADHAAARVSCCLAGAGAAAAARRHPRP